MDCVRESIRGTICVVQDLFGRKPDGTRYWYCTLNYKVLDQPMEDDCVIIPLQTQLYKVPTRLRYLGEVRTNVHVCVCVYIVCMCVHCVCTCVCVYMCVCTLCVYILCVHFVCVCVCVCTED